MATSPEEAAVRVIDLLSAIKELVAASSRSPELLNAQINRLAYDQRDTISRFSVAFEKVLRGEENYSSTFITKHSNSGPQRKSSGMDSLTKSSPSNSPLPSPRGSPQQFSPISPFVTANANIGELTDCTKQFKDALLGIPDTPNDLESYPAPLAPGLVHGESALMKALFKQHPRVLAFLVDRFERDSEAFEALVEANMLWVGKYPLDFAASGKETALWQRLASTSGSGHRKKDLSSKMRHLLLLNLQLHYPPAEWVDALSVRDRVIDILSKACREIPRCTAEIEEAFRRADVVVPALELIRIDASPLDVLQLITEKVAGLLILLDKIVQGATKESFFSRLTAESRQLRSVIRMIESLASELKDEIEHLASSAAGPPQQCLSMTAAMPTTAAGDDAGPRHPEEGELESAAVDVRVVENNDISTGGCSGEENDTNAACVGVPPLALQVPIGSVAGTGNSTNTSEEAITCAVVDPNPNGLGDARVAEDHLN